MEMTEIHSQQQQRHNQYAPPQSPSLRPPPRRRHDDSIPSSPTRTDRPFSPVYPSNSYDPSSYSSSTPTSPSSPSRHLPSSRIGALDSHLDSPMSSNGPSSTVTAAAAVSSFSRGSVYDDPRKRRQETLAMVDNAEFGWFHVRACMVAGVGFFTDAYDLFAINLVSPMLGFVYFSHNGNTVPADVDLGLKISASVGTFFGQVGFGYLADKLGRKRMYGVELVIIIVATFGQSLCGDSYALSLPMGIILWRFILGIGVGGDYPLSAVITSEFATTNRRGAMMAAVFAMQGFGYLTTGIVAIILLLGFRSLIEDDPRNLDYVWRCLIGLGCVPALVAVYFRLTIPETPRFVMDVENNIGKAERDVATVLKTRNALQSTRDVVEDRNTQFNLVQPRKNSLADYRYDSTTNSSAAADRNGRGAVGGNSGFGQDGYFHLHGRDSGSAQKHRKTTMMDFIRYFSRWENFKILMGTSMTWFALDVAFYGIGLNNTFILSTIHFGSVSGDAYHTMWNATVGQVIIVMLGAIPGYWFTVALIERMGRIRIQVLGFVMSCILFCILGFAYNQIRNLSPVLFVFLFAITQFFQNFGPNATTFIIPGEVFPTRYRSTGHGISAGMGKLGAIAAQIGFSSMKDRGGTNMFIPQLLQIFALFMFIGLLFTYFVPETKGKTLEELCGDDDYAVKQLQRERPYQNPLHEEKEEGL